MKVDFFLLGISFILMHEMDAIRCKEWRIFPGLSKLDDRQGLLVFTLAHIPLFYWILSAIQAGNENLAKGLDIFLIVHILLHLALFRHPKNEFKDWLSWVLIVGAGLCGAIDLLLRQPLFD